MSATTTNAAITPGPILAFALGKYKSVACAYDHATAPVIPETKGIKKSAILVAVEIIPS